MSNEPLVTIRVPRTRKGWTFTLAGACALVAAVGGYVWDTQRQHDERFGAIVHGQNSLRDQLAVVNTGLLVLQAGQSQIERRVERIEDAIINHRLSAAEWKAGGQ